MKLLFLACIMALAMSAQTLTGLSEHKVSLAGSPDSPFVVNSTGKSIVGYVLIETHSNGEVSIDMTMCNPTTVPLLEGLPIGPGANNKAPNKAAKPVHRDGTPVVISSAVLDSVLFADGELVGPNKADIFKLISLGFGMNKEQALKSLLDPARLKGDKK
jgi:hypothetical protein